MTNFQRKGAISYTHVEREFEEQARESVAENCLNLDPNQ